jgi:molecular chaperone DnaJ
VLCDPRKRRVYDQFGAAGTARQQGFHHYEDIGDALSAFMRDFGGLGGFEGFFGGGRRRGPGGREPGQNLQVRVS